MEEYLADSNLQIVNIENNNINLHCIHCDLDIKLVKRTLQDSIRLKREPEELCKSCKRCKLLNNSFNTTDIYIRQSTSKQVIVECKKCGIKQIMHRVAFDTKLKKFYNDFTSWCATCSKNNFDSDRIDTFKQEMKQLYNHDIIHHNPMTREVIYTCGNCGSINNKSFVGNFKREGYTGCCSKCLNDKNRNRFEDVCNIIIKAGHKIAMTKDEYKSNKDVYFYCNCGNPNKEKTSLHRLSNGSGCIKCSKTRAFETIKEQYGCTDPSVTNIMHFPDIYYKSVCNAYKLKDYKLPSGKIIQIQGYENRAIDILLSGEFKCPTINTKIVEDMINVGNQVSSFTYKYKDNVHKYYPDIFIKDTNVFIEVKSDYTFMKEFDKNMAKFLSFVERDEHLIVLIFDEKVLTITMYF